MICTKGDLAFIKKALRNENIGRVVTCTTYLGFYQHNEYFMWNGERLMSPDTDHIWVVESSSGIETMFGNSKQAVIPDSWLFPIKAAPLNDEEEEFINNLDRILELVEK